MAEEPIHLINYAIWYLSDSVGDHRYFIVLCFFTGINPGVIRSLIRKADLVLKVLSPGQNLLAGKASGL